MGLWQDDLKHGVGELKLPSGVTIKATWNHGLKNGKAEIIKITGKIENVTYINDIELN